MVSITNLVGDELAGYTKWEGCVLGGGGDYVYGIPYNDSHMVKFDPRTKSIEAVGLDLGSDRSKWKGGVLVMNRYIYCVPYCSPFLLKYDTVLGTCTLISNLPESGQYKWSSGALAPDGNVYFMPFFGARFILKLDPRDDTVESVGIDLGGGGFKFSGTVVGGDGCVYGIPYQTNRIIKFNPRDQCMTIVGKVAEGFFKCGNGALARDGSIYAANGAGTVLKIDIIADKYSFVGNAIQSNHRYEGWRSAIMGGDGCIYWPPCNAIHTLKFVTGTERSSLVGDDFGNGGMKWSDGVLASDGAIYCIPTSADQVLAIDPIQEFVTALRTGMEHHPDELGLLFQMIDEEGGITRYESAVSKYGFDKTLEIIEDCISLYYDDIYSASNSSLEGYMVAASCENSALSLIYALMKRNPPI